jgi:hypothetical protein
LFKIKKLILEIITFIFIKIVLDKNIIDDDYEDECYDFQDELFNFEQILRMS